MAKELIVVLLAGALLGVGLAQPLRAGWGDDLSPAPPPADQKVDTATPDDKKPELQESIVEEKESWKKYSFNLKLADGSGNVTFDDLARSGHAFVLVWWLSDCPVCHMQMPYVQQLARLGDDKNVDVKVVGINIDDTDRDCNDYIREKKLNFNVLRDPHGRGTDNHYGIRNEGTPMTYVFKSGGDFAGKLSGYTKNYPSKVLGMLGIKMPEQMASNGISIQRADGTTQTRSFQ